jgi:hypothetical protein
MRVDRFVPPSDAEQARRRDEAIALILAIGARQGMPADQAQQGAARAS